MVCRNDFTYLLIIDQYLASSRYWFLRAISKNYKKKYLPPEKFVNLLKKDFLLIVLLQLGIYGEV